MPCLMCVVGPYLCQDRLGLGFGAIPRPGPEEVKQRERGASEREGRYPMVETARTLLASHA